MDGQLVGRSLLHLVVVYACLTAACHPTAEPLEWSTVSELIAADFPSVPSVTTAELASAMAAGRAVVLLDAREPAEYAVSHLRGAHRVTTAADAAAVLEGVAPDALVVAYCSVGYRSAKLAQDLREQGVTSVMNLEGSIFAWANEGRPVYRGDRRVDAVHPFDTAWGALLDRLLWAYEPTADTAP